MAILKTKKIIVLGLQGIKDSFLKVIQKEGLVHLESLKESVSKNKEELEELGGIDEAIKFLSLYQEKKFLGEIFKEPLILDKKSFKTQDYKEIENIAKEVLELKEKLNSLNEELKEKSKQKELLEQWSFLDIDFKDLKGTKFISLIPTFSDEKVLKQILDKGPLKNGPYFICPEKGKRRKISFLFVAKKNKEDFLAYLAQNKVSPFSFPSFLLEEYPENNPQQAKKILEEKIELLNKEREKIEERLEKLVPFREKLMIFSDFLFNEMLREKTKASFLNTQKTFILEGWVLKKDEEKVKAILENFKETIYFLTREPKKGENPPVKLENKKIIKPFEVVVNMYGAPNPYSLDPTAFLAPFLFMFVGICISDAGYGLVLATLSFYFLKKKKIASQGRNFLTLIFYLGISTFIVGLLLGGVFGLPFKAFQVIDPLKNTFTFLVFCFILGFIQVLAGMFLKVYSEIKKKNFLRSIADTCWVLLLLNLLFYFKYRIPFLKYSGIFLTFVILLFASPSKNIFVRIAKGLYELYGITRYFSDILSYSRLVALGLATGVIAMVVNLIAKLAFKLPILGIILGIGVLIIGHSFNIFINLLSGLIHSGRLQFVEFFSKFFELGGRFFEPFSFKTRYVYLKD